MSLDPTFDEAAFNRFGRLEIEDLGDADVVIPSFEQTSSNSKTSTAPRAVEPEFSEEDLFSEMIIRVIGLFDDLHAIQDHLKAIWLDYKKGNTSLITATMTTNAALCLVERTEQELVSLWPDTMTYRKYTPHPDRSYHCLTLFFRPQYLGENDSGQLDISA